MQRQRYRRLATMVVFALMVGALIPFLTSQHTASASTTEPSGSNIAVGHIASTDSAQSTEPASQGDDGDATSYWCANNSSTGHWWMIDLGAYNNLSGVGINFGATAFYQYTIQVSADNSTWTTAATQTSNTNTNPYQYDAFSVSAERYVKITITGMQSGFWACMAEFKVYATSQGENVAQGKSASADSVQSSNPASAAVDGTVDTRWSAANSSTGHFLTVDLKYNYNLNGAQVIWETAGNAYQYKIDSSLDNSTWTTVVNQTTSTSTSQVRYTTFTQIKARYVRITVTGLPSTSVWASIRDFEVFQPFMKGVDASTLIQMENHGAVYSANGSQGNFLQLLKNDGVNYVRVRLWVNPANPPLSLAGVDDLPYVEAMATQIKAMGLQFFLDFHYSDNWADPGHQSLPAAWAGQSTSQLAATVKTYTTSVITALKNQGTLPDMVQIGNETNCGMLWPTGDVCTSSANWSNFASYVNAGISGVNAALSSGQSIRIALQYAGDTPQSWLNSLISNGVTGFDTIGLSYYTFWHGNLDSLEATIPSLRTTYSRDVIVAEYAYPWTFTNFDSTGNSVVSSTVSSALQSAYPIGTAGQYQLVEDELATVKDTGGLGAFYWEPGWYAVSGAGWEGGQGDGWENMAQVDQSGNALPSLSVYLRY